MPGGFGGGEIELALIGRHNVKNALAVYALGREMGIDRAKLLEGFASFFGADFYGLPRNTTTLTMRREAWRAPEHFAFGQAELKPLRAGETLAWRVV